MTMLSLLLLDDHPLVHVALEAALITAGHPYLLTAQPDDSQALAWLSHQRCDVLILDIGLPQVDGLQLLKKIRRHHPQQRIVIYTAQEEAPYARLAYQAGANGFVHKSASLQQLVQCIERVMQGERVFPPSLTNEQQENGAGLPLTAKELQVLGLLSKGLSNLQIAGMLNISNKTVSTHKKNILRKTGAANLLELAAVFKELAP